LINDDVKSEPAKLKKVNQEKFKRRDVRTSSLFAKNALCSTIKNISDDQAMFEAKKVKSNTVKENKDVMKKILAKRSKGNHLFLNKEKPQNDEINVGYADEDENFSEFFNQEINNENDKCSKPMPAIRSGDWTCRRCKNLNFVFRNSCNRCNFKRTPTDKYIPPVKKNLKDNQNIEIFGFPGDNDKIPLEQDKDSHTSLKE